MCFTVYLDTFKAFDSVWLNRFISKACLVGFEPIAAQLMKMQ